MLENNFYKNLLALAIGFGCFSSALLSFEMPFWNNCQCIQYPAFADISLSHTEGKGLGYSQGYSSAALFLAQPVYDSQLIPFVDLRGHVFNNGKLAMNAGLGLRWLNSTCNRAWGINCFYDSFLRGRLPYHQVTLGLEALSDTWDIRVNGYLPVGKRKANIYELSYDFSTGFLAKAREQFAMSGVDAEVGYNFCAMQYFNLYAGLGPYVYWGRSQKTKNAFRATHKEAIGARVRAIATFLTCCELEAVAGYDSRFKWTGQATLSVNMPFDMACCFGQLANICSSCSFVEHLFQPTRRNEIIVIDRINRFSSNPAILDPEFEP